MAPVSGERMNDKILWYMQRVVRNSRNPEFMNEVKDACLKSRRFVLRHLMAFGAAFCAQC